MMSCRRQPRSIPPFPLRAATLALALAVSAAALGAQAPEPNMSVLPVEDEPSTRTMEMKRLTLPSAAAGEELPYTISVPVDWQVRRDLPAPDGVYLGPSEADPGEEPLMLLVRASEVELSDPETILGNLKANEEEGAWTLLEGEVREFGRASGLWIVRGLPASGLFGERINAAVKLPLGTETSVDVLATVPTEAYTGVLRLQVEYMLGSIRPVEPDAPAEGEGSSGE